MPWANGMGTTSVVARVPDDDRWVWRLSLADVVVDGPFSRLPGVDRSIVVASGAGMRLAVGDDTTVELTPSSPSFGFDGAVETTCTLIDGPIVDLNLMVRRGEAVGSLVVHHLVPGDSLEVAIGVVLEGSIAVGDDVLGRFDAMLGGDLQQVVALEATRVATVSVATG